jgi:hypothetical protein
MQPDFSALFRREKIAPIHFRVRDGACFVHDLHFLSSYLHDARFSASAVKKGGKKLSLVVERDCWEFGHTKHARSSELHIAKSRLTITPVSGVRWTIRDPKLLEQELWIESVYPGTPHWEISGASELVISAPHAGWRLCISIAEDFGDIRLDDLETPYLDSARKG